MQSRAKQAPDVITDVITGKRINLLDWKAANVRASIMLSLLMIALLVIIAYLLAQVTYPEYSLLFVGGAIIIAATQNMTAYWFGDQIALRGAAAQPANKDQHRYLINVTEAVAIGAGIPTPKIYVIDADAPNAFATGRNPEHSSIAVTTGLLALLDRQELEGVIAHELAHIKHFDVLLSSMLAATLGAILLLRDVAFRARYYGGVPRRRGRQGEGGGNAQAIMMLLLVVLLVLAPLMATLLKLAVSRKREFLADAAGAYITRNPEGLARALQKLRDYSGAPLKVSEGVEHMFFTSPKQRLNAANLFATHPPIEDRINRLQRM